MKATSLALLTLGLISCLSPCAFAQSFDAIVTGVTEGGSGIQATVTDESGKTEKNVMFHLLPDVDLSDYKTMDKIREGNRLKIEAEKDANDNWQISRIEPYQKS